MIEALIGVVQAVYTFVATNLGLKADVADSTGTVHAKLTYLFSKFITNTASSKIGTANSTSVSYVTAHSYTGAGTLRMIAHAIVSRGTTPAYVDSSVKITIDGVVLYDGVAGKSGNTAATSCGSSLTLVNSPIAFNTSLLIEHKVGTTSDFTAMTAWHYTV